MRERVTLQREFELLTDRDRESRPAPGTRPSAAPRPVDPVRAARQSRQSARALGWKKHAGAVLRLLRLEGPRLSQTFAQAVADWQRRNGLVPDGVIGSATWAAMRRAIAPGPAREIELETPSVKARLSGGALGDAFADLQSNAGVPDEVATRLRASSTFRALTAPIDKAYIALGELMASGEPGDMADDGRLTKGKFRARRVLQVFSTIGTTAFHRARTVDNLATTDLADIGTPTAQSGRPLVQAWMMRILWTVIQIAQVTEKKKPPAALGDRIKACAKALVAARKTMDAVLREIDAADKDFKIGTLFDGFDLLSVVEIGYYPADLVFDAPFVLTNLEQCALLERMEEARRREKLNDTSIEQLKKQVDAISLGGADDLAMRLRFPFPVFFNDKSQLFELIPSDFATYYYGRRLLDRRWRLFDPAGKDWKKDPDVTDMRRAHAEAYFADVTKYLIDP